MDIPEFGTLESTYEVPKHDLNSILCSPSRDFLVLNNGDQVKVNSLKKDIVGLYFSASWCAPCQKFTPTLTKVYEQLKQLGKNFEIVLVTLDKKFESFDACFSVMPWLAIPFSDSETPKQLRKLFCVDRIPRLVILDQTGELLQYEGVRLIDKYEVKGYPFTPQHIEELIEQQEEEAKRNLESLLVSNSRDFLIKKVPVAELEGSYLALYFVSNTNEEHEGFNSKLVEVYEELKATVRNFEIVMIHNDSEPSFFDEFKDVPWLSLPLNDNRFENLIRYFKVKDFPTAVVIGPQGETIHANVVDAIKEHGAKAFPFTPEKFAELEELKKAKQELESLLILKDIDFVIEENGLEIPVSSLVGKNILLFFSAKYCSACADFLPRLNRAYERIYYAFARSIEVIFISSDEDQETFDKFFTEMPWLAIPFGDERIKLLSRLFKVSGIPKVVAIGKSGKMVTTEACELIVRHGSEAYPFTVKRVMEIGAETEMKVAEGWQEKVKYDEHEHEVVLTKRQFYVCDKCNEEGGVWSYYCEECDCNLHLKCALEKGGDEENVADEF